MISLMKNKPVHRTVNPYPAANRPGYCAMFADPRKRERRRNVSLSTRDLTEAKEICLHLERLINNPGLWDAKNPTLTAIHPRAYSIFFGREQEPPTGEIRISPGNTLVGNKRMLPFSIFRSTEYAKAQQRIAELDNELFGLRREADALRQENFALRRAAGKHVTATLEEAVEEWKRIYPTGRNPHTVREATNATTSFVNAVGHSTPLASVKAGHIDQWLADYKSPKGQEVTPVTKRRVRAYVSSFFSWAYRNYVSGEKCAREKYLRPKPLTFPKAFKHVARKYAKFLSASNM